MAKRSVYNDRRDGPPSMVLSETGKYEYLMTYIDNLIGKARFITTPEVTGKYTGTSRKETCYKMAFAMLFGLYAFTSMPFRSQWAPVPLECLMDRLKGRDDSPQPTYGFYCMYLGGLRLHREYHHVQYYPDMYSAAIANRYYLVFAVALPSTAFAVLSDHEHCGILNIMKPSRCSKNKDLPYLQQY